jgi:acyl-CoA synthetase (AMP-forming)/AMP-acid ligase II
VLTHGDMLRRCASAYPQRIAITSEQGVDIIYERFDALTTIVARRLQAAGLGPGDRLAWLDRNSADYLIGYFATAKLGMTVTPLNLWLRAGEIAPQLELVRPAAIVAGSEFIALAERATDGLDLRLRIELDRENPSTDPRAHEWQPWAELCEGEATPLDIGVDENDVHEIVFTSGTTGQAKGVMRTQRARILDSAFAALGYQVSRNDHLLWILPQFHIGGGAVTNQLLIQGGRVTILRQFGPAAVAAALRNDITYLLGVPAHYGLLLESGELDGVDTSSVTGCYVGGSIATQELLQRIQVAFPGADLVHGYGSTESGPHTMALRGEDFTSHLGSLGMPVAGTEVRVVTTDGVDAADDEVGELWTRSDSTMAGYLDRPELTDAVLSPDGWLRTGDLVRRAPDGFYYLVDRVKDIIITGGENVYPREVEDVIAALPGVAEVAVIGVPDPVYEERVVALIRALPDATPPSETEVIAYVRDRLAGYKTPKVVHTVEDFPRTGAGKIAKPKLRDTYGHVLGDRR